MTLLSVHIVAGLVGVSAAFTALYTVKGARFHLQSGLVFVCAMLGVAATAGIIAPLRGQRFNAMQAALTAYLIITGWRTIKRRVYQADGLDAIATIAAMIVAGYDLMLGLEAANTPLGSIDGAPAAMVLLFGTVAFIAALGDVRLFRHGSPNGAARVTRHLWRMCFAAFIATGSFFLGQARVIPEPIRIYPLLMIPALLPMVVMFYWLWRVRARRPHRDASTITLRLPQAH